MNFRQRVRQAAEVARANSHEQIYKTVRKWAGSTVPKEPIATPRLNCLLDRVPRELSIGEIIEVADHISVHGLTERQTVVAAAQATRRGAFPLPRVPVVSGVAALLSTNEPARDMATRFATWSGYVATPALAQVGRFEEAIKLLLRFTRRLTMADYKNVDGAGSFFNAEIRLLFLAPVLGGLTEHCPSDRPGGRGGVLLARFFRQMERLQPPPSECVLIRLACLGIVAKHRGVQPFLQNAYVAAVERHEKELATYFKIFAEAPSLLASTNNPSAESTAA